MRAPSRVSSVRRNRTHDQLLEYHNTLTLLTLELDRVIASDQVGREWACGPELRSFIAWADKEKT